MRKTSFERPSRKKKSGRDWNGKRLGLIALIVGLVIAAVGAYFLLQSDREDKVTTEDFLNNVQYLAKNSHVMPKPESFYKEIQVPANSKLKFEDNTIIAIVDEEKHSYPIGKKFSGSHTLDSGEYWIGLLGEKATNLKEYRREENTIKVVIKRGSQTAG